MFAMARLLPPVLETVTVCAVLLEPTTWEANVRAAGARVIAAGLTPLPVRAILCGEPLAESAISSWALRVPVAVGVKVTETVQLTPAASVVPQVLLNS